MRLQPWLHAVTASVTCGYSLGCMRLRSRSHAIAATVTTGDDTGHIANGIAGHVRHDVKHDAMHDATIQGACDRRGGRACRRRRSGGACRAELRQSNRADPRSDRRHKGPGGDGNERCDTPLRRKVGHIARGTLPMMTMIKKNSQTRAQCIINACQHAYERTIYARDHREHVPKGWSHCVASS